MVYHKFIAGNETFSSWKNTIIILHQTAEVSYVAFVLSEVFSIIPLEINVNDWVACIMDEGDSLRRDNKQGTYRW